MKKKAIRKKCAFVLFLTLFFVSRIFTNDTVFDDEDVRCELFEDSESIDEQAVEIAMVKRKPKITFSMLPLYVKIAVSYIYQEKIKPWAKKVSFYGVNSGSSVNQK